MAMLTYLKVVLLLTYKVIITKYLIDLRERPTALSLRCILKR